jgi:hypothetical protein
MTVPTAELRALADEAAARVAQNMEDVAEKAATKAVHSVLITLGVDVNNPLEAQRNFQTLRDLTKLAGDPEFQKDLQHMRIWRIRTEAMTTKGMIALLTAAAGGVATVFVYGLQSIVSVLRLPQ